VHLVAQLACAVYWFHPVVLDRRARRSAVKPNWAADDGVLGAGLEASQYAADMVEIVRACRPDLSSRAPAVAMARVKHLEHRIAAAPAPGANPHPIAPDRGGDPRRPAILPGATAGGDDWRRGRFNVEVRAVALPAAIQTSMPSGLEPVAPTVRVGRAGGAARCRVGGIGSLPVIEEYTTPPLYSDEARRRGVEGIVTIAFRVDERGHVAGCARS
jgi:hypothetical protein